jgi:hypothetical protein
VAARQEFVNNVIVALPLWKFDSASPVQGGFSWNLRRFGASPDPLNRSVKVFRQVHACEIVGTFSGAGVSVGARRDLRLGCKRAWFVRGNFFRL